MGIHTGEQKRPIPCAMYFSEHFWIASTKTFTVELKDVSRSWYLNKNKVEEFLYPRSEDWPGQDRYTEIEMQKIYALEWHFLEMKGLYTFWTTGKMVASRFDTKISLALFFHLKSMFL